MIQIMHVRMGYNWLRIIHQSTLQDASHEQAKGGTRRIGKGLFDGKDATCATQLYFPSGGGGQEVQSAVDQMVQESLTHGSPLHGSHHVAHDAGSSLLGNIHCSAGIHRHNPVILDALWI